MPADVLRRHYREPVVRQPLGVRVSLVGYAVDMRPLRVHVPAFSDSDLPGVDSITASRTVYLLSPGKGKFTSPDDKTTEVEQQSGQVQWLKAETHAVENAGTTDTRVLMIELKK